MDQQRKNFETEIKNLKVSMSDEIEQLTSQFS